MTGTRTAAMMTNQRQAERLMLVSCKRSAMMPAISSRKTMEAPDSDHTTHTETFQDRHKIGIPF